MGQQTGRNAEQSFQNVVENFIDNAASIAKS